MGGGVERDEYSGVDAGFGRSSGARASHAPAGKGVNACVDMFVHGCVQGVCMGV